MRSYEYYEARMYNSPKKTKEENIELHNMARLAYLIRNNNEVVVRLVKCERKYYKALFK